MRFACLAVTFWIATSSVHAAGLTVGAAQVDITPPVGIPMAGYYSVRGAEGTHDPLWAKVIVFEQDGTRAALVGLDLITTTFGMVTEARQAIEAKTGIPGSHVMISATHSHTGPVLAGRGPRDDVFGGNSNLVGEYMKVLPQKIAEAVTKADAARRPARISQVIGNEENLAFNRRFHMMDGTVGWNPGKKNPRIVRPAGPVDAAVPIVYVEGTDGKPIAAYVNFAMHLDTVGGMYFSSDYAYTLSKALTAAKGESLVTLFTIGCAGDINHINVKSPLPQKGHGEAARIGTRLAGEVLRAWDDLTPATEGKMFVSRETVDLPLAPITPADVEKAREVADQVRGGAKPAPKFLDQVHAFKTLDVQARLGKPYAVEVQVIALGDDVAFVSLPGEIFVRIGLEIKKQSPFKNTIIAELANGAIGYIPDRPAYPEGNYEVVSARCAEGSGELLIASAVKQLNALHGKE